MSENPGSRMAGVSAQLFRAMMPAGRVNTHDSDFEY